MFWKLPIQNIRSFAPFFDTSTSIIVPTKAGIEQVSPTSGRVEWMKSNVRAASLSQASLYALAQSGSDQFLLSRIDPPTGRTIWETPIVDGKITAFSSGVLLSTSGVIAAYDTLGREIWKVSSPGAYQDVSIAGDYVIATTAGSGSTIHLEANVYSASDGQFYGTISFGPIVGSSRSNVYAERDNVANNLETWCEFADVINLPLNDVSGTGLEPTILRYDLEPVNINERTPCVGARMSPPKVIVRNGVTVLTSGSRAAIFTGSGSKASFDNAALLNLSSDGVTTLRDGTDILFIDSHLKERKASGVDASALSASPLNDRLYVGTPSRIIVVNVNTLKILARYSVPCPFVSTLGNSHGRELLYCSNDSQGGQGFLMAL